MTYPIFSIGFRPFFFLTALSGLFFPITWIAFYMGHMEFPGLLLTDRMWHAHEMIFGFTSALIAGFLLTASANWTKTTPVRGNPLMMLVALWLLERCLLVVPVPKLLALIAALPFGISLIVILARKLAGHNRQFYVFVPLLTLYVASDIFFLLGAYFEKSLWIAISEHVALHVIAFIIILILGRVVPFFTRSRLPEVKADAPALVNKLALLGPLLLILPFPKEGFSVWYIIVYAIALVFGSVRLGAWKPHKILSVPILWILHLGMFWMLVYFGVGLAGVFHPWIEDTFISWHALSTGGLGVVAIGMMSRVSLGHTGRVIHADASILTTYALVNLGALARVFIPLIWPESFMEAYWASALCWSLAFLIFTCRFTAVYWTPRPDGKA